jgi:hypothetical protein
MHGSFGRDQVKGLTIWIWLLLKKKRNCTADGCYRARYFGSQWACQCRYPFGDRGWLFSNIFSEHSRTFNNAQSAEFKVYAFQPVRRTECYAITEEQRNSETVAHGHEQDCTGGGRIRLWTTSAPAVFASRPTCARASHRQSDNSTGQYVCMAAATQNRTITSRTERSAAATYNTCSLTLHVEGEDRDPERNGTLHDKRILVVE